MYAPSSVLIQKPIWVVLKNGRAPVSRTIFMISRSSKTHPCNNLNFPILNLHSFSQSFIFFRIDLISLQITLTTPNNTLHCGKNPPWCNFPPFLGGSYQIKKTYKFQKPKRGVLTKLKNLRGFSFKKLGHFSAKINDFRLKFRENPPCCKFFCRF